MAWSERQRRLLAAIGVRVFAPSPAAAAAGTAVAVPEGTVAPGVHGMPGAPGGDAAVAAPVARAGVADSHAPPAAPRMAPAPGDRPATTPAHAPTSAAAPPRRPASPVGAPAASPGAAPQVPFEADPRIATLDWPALREAVAGCTACALSQSRRQTVFGVGHPRAHWMIVGEAPGEREDEAGEPFVGPAGQLLDQMLRAVGLTRGEADEARQVFIANTLKCRPPRNRNPEPAELARCEPFLRRQIALVQPRLLLAMGRFAVKALLDTDEPIGRLRGRVHRFEGVPVVVTYHPAYLLRNLGDKARAWDDLCLAAAMVEAGPPRA